MYPICELFKTCKYAYKLYCQERCRNKLVSEFSVCFCKSKCAIVLNIIQHTDCSIHRFLSFHLGAKQTFNKKKILASITRFSNNLRQYKLVTDGSTFNETMYHKGHQDLTLMT